MKKTLITAAVAFAMGISVSAQADNDTITSADLLAIDLGITGSFGDESPVSNTPKSSYNTATEDALNTNISHGFNDVNSHNGTGIGEDGIVATAQNLDQAVANSDMNHLIGNAGGSVTVAGPAAGGNLLIDNGAVGTAGGVLAHNGGVFSSTLGNAISAGSFNNFGGVSSASQNVGQATSVGQSVVVQSNGGV